MSEVATLTEWTADEVTIFFVICIALFAGLAWITTRKGDDE